MALPLYILAGGRSSRFGRDKAREVVDGLPLVLHVARALAPVTTRVTAVVDRPGRVADLGLREITDGGAHLGPLAGLCAALADAPEGWLVLAPCDVLGMQAAWLRDLQAAVEPGDLAAACHDGRWQPLPLLVHTAAAPLARTHLRSGDRSLSGLLAALPARQVPVPTSWHAALRVDTPADLLAWHRLA